MFSKENMAYSDYGWTSKAEVDNPQVIEVNDRSKLHRTEGYEMIYYIRSLAKSWDWKEDAIRACQKLEKTIREKVPSNIQTYGEIKSWIEANFKTFWDAL